MAEELDRASKGESIGQVMEEDYRAGSGGGYRAGDRASRWWMITGQGSDEGIHQDRGYRAGDRASRWWMITGQGSDG
ncbi:hypothetical protein Dimus_016358, partial [Dionaea muscipula]